MSDAGLDILIAGAGNMGGAIARGLVERAGRSAGAVGVIDPDAGRLAPFNQAGFATAQTPAALAPRLAPDALLVLAIKPQVLPDAAADLRPLASGRLIVSILAGAPREAVARALTDPTTRAAPRCVIRAMPNTPALVGRGLSAIARAPDADAEDLARARSVLQAVGETIDLDEALLDAFTAVVGSGPAYVFLLTEALAGGARSVGFDAALADRLARATVVGAAALLDASGDSPATLRQRVTSKGGTTAAALEVLQAGGFEALLARAIVAARDRGAQLARELARTDG